MDEMHANRPPVPKEEPQENKWLAGEDFVARPPRCTVETGSAQAEDTPLHDAAADGDVKKVRAWLDLGVDVNAQNRNGNTALHIASREGKADVVRLLRAQSGIDETIENSFGQTPAACAKDKAVKAAFAETPRKSGLRSVPKTPSMPQRAGFALEYANNIGIDFSADDESAVRSMLLFICWAVIGGMMASIPGLVPLYIAAVVAPAFTLMMVAEHFHAKNRREHKLMKAVSEGKLDEVSARLREGANPNGCGYGYPLHEAVKTGNAEIVRKLLACGADPNVRDEEGYTPLFRAVQSESRELADVLRASPHTDLDIPNNEGQTARDFLHMVDGREGESETDRFLREFKQEDARATKKPRMPSPRRKSPQGPEPKP